MMQKHISVRGYIVAIVLFDSNEHRSSVYEHLEQYDEFIRTQDVNRK